MNMTTPWCPVALPKSLPIGIGLLCVGLLTQCGQTKTLISKVKETVTNSSSANKPKAPETSGAVMVVADGRAPAFQAVVNHLELGGRAFSFNERLGKSPDICVLLDKFISVVPPEVRPVLPKDFSFTQLTEMMGLAGIQATGKSQRIRSDGSYHTRTFSYIPQPRTGLLTLSGDTSKRLLTLDLAPQNTDLAIEFNLRLRDLFQTLIPYLEKTLPKPYAEQMRAALNAPVLALGIPTLQELLEKIDCRVAYFSRLDPSQPPSTLSSGITLEATESALVIENIDWLVKALRAQMMPLLKSPGSHVEIKDSDDILEATFKSTIGTGPLAIKPTLRFDSKLNRLIIATSPQIMTEVVAASGAIRGQTEFAQAWEGLPEDGSLAFYSSARQQKSIMKSIIAGVGDGLKGKGASPVDPKQLTTMVESILGGANPRASAMVMSNLPDGILCASNTTVPTVDEDVMITIASIGIISAIAMPHISNINEAAENAQRQRLGETQPSTTSNPLINHLRAYARLNSGKYPKALKELVEAGIVEDEAKIKVTDPSTGEVKDWLYNARLTSSSPPTALAFAAPYVQPDGSRLVVYHSGTIEFISEEQLEQLILAQQTAPSAVKSIRRASVLTE